MRIQNKKSGLKNIFIVLACGFGVSIFTMLLISMIAAALIHHERLGIDAIKIYATVALFVSSILGNLTSVMLSGEKKIVAILLHPCIMLTIIMLLVIIIGTGMSRMFGVGTLAIILGAAGSMGICTLKESNKHRIKKRYC